MIQVEVDLSSSHLVTTVNKIILSRAPPEDSPQCMGAFFFLFLLSLMKLHEGRLELGLQRWPLGTH